MKNYRNIRFASIALAGLVILSGCSSVKSSNEQNQANNVTAQDLVKEVVDTVCTLSGKTKLMSEDIEVFRDMADKLNTYSGDDSMQLQKTADQLESFANTYEMMVGVELDQTITDQFVTGCNESQDLYDQAYAE